MRYILLLLWIVLSTTVHALSLKPDAPARYVVQRGDSLWTIASRYLQHPWEWKELWRANPNIKNPSKLYAGAVLVLRYNHKSPYIRVLSNGTVKLSPTMRGEPLDDLIPPIPLGEIRPFLSESLILDEDVLSRAPYVVAFMGERLVGGQGDGAYVKGLHSSTKMPDGGTIAYSLFRPRKVFKDPITKKLLGYQASIVGYGELEAGGEPATIVLTNIVEGINKDDKVLINNSPDFDLAFEPQAPSVDVNGLIIEMPIHMPSGTSQGATGNVVILNRGAENGLKAGDVLGIFGKLRIVKDPRNPFISIKLPPERIGEVLVFRPFTKTSFALIVRSTRAVYLEDVVGNP